MTSAEWNTSTDPAKMLQWLTGYVNVQSDYRRNVRVSDRKLRLFAVACCYAVWDRLTDPRSRRAVEVAELYADGLATDDDLYTARLDAGDAEEEWPAFHTTHIVAAEAARRMVDPDSRLVADVRGEFPPPATQCQIIRSIIGDPFGPVRIDPQCLTPDVRAIAARIYDERDWDAMPMLADALETSGCEDVRVLEWLRGRERCDRCKGHGWMLGEYATGEYKPCDDCRTTGRIQPVRCRGDHVLDAILGRE